MKTALTIILFCFLNQIYGQKCGCYNNEDLKNLISCKSTKFQNGAKIYWEYDCDSSWITFQNGKIKKKIFELEKEFIDYSGRLGYRNWSEYNKSFLIENSLVSGCCQPGEYILYNKNNGEKIAKLGTIVFIDNSKDFPFTITLRNNQELLFTNLNENKSCSIKIPKDRIEKTLQNSNELYPENLFQNIKLENGLLIIQLKYKESKNSIWKTELIKYDAKKYCR